MNRRHFLKGTGTALLGVATLGLALKPEEPKAVQYEELPIDKHAYSSRKSNFPTITSRAQELWEKQRKLYEESINNYKRIEDSARRATMRELERFKGVFSTASKTS